ncbi:MAG: penicillin-binding protein 2 [Flavobacteriaceae bacterium]|nr:penicillin-binding protein 2 [Flavobacteriaceae bacterium]
MSSKQINLRLYLISGIMFLTVFLLIGKLIYIQWIEENSNVEIPNQVVKNVVLEPDRGDIYTSDGKILATSVYSYELRWDSQSPSRKVFETNKKELSVRLGKILNQNSDEVLAKLENARATNKRYLLIAQKADYQKMKAIKELPIFNQGEISGGLIVERRVQRKLPMQKYATRTIGYEKQQPSGAYTRTGIEGSYSQYLRGQVGYRLKKRIARGVWKPISDSEYRKPIPGGNLITTIDSYIQQTTHEALEQQMIDFEAAYGSAVVMHVKTGHVKAIVNLTRNTDSTYSEKFNYAIANSYEPGSTFKTFSLMAAMEDKKINPESIVNIGNGEMTFFGRHKIRDSHKPKNPEISVSKALEVSSNVAVAKVVFDAYNENPHEFLNRIASIGLDKPLNLGLLGEPNPYIPHPSDELWSKISLPWMAYGYGLSLTPLQMLTYYNGIANDGQVLKPQFVKSIQRSNQQQIDFDKEIINPSMASESTVEAIQQMLNNVVEKQWGTAHRLHSKIIPIAGKTGTAQENYTTDQMNYVSSFVGYFPAQEPQYSMIVVIHKPNKRKGYYGSTVAAPVVKQVASKIITAIPDEVFLNNRQIASVMTKYESPSIPIEDLLQNQRPTATNDIVAAGQISVESGQEAVDNATIFLNKVGKLLGIKVIIENNRQERIADLTPP